jgi:hypothetical protein
MTQISMQDFLLILEFKFYFRKENVDKEWNFVKENIPSVENSPGASKEILQAFNSDKVIICKKFSAQSKEFSLFNVNLLF